MRAIEFIKKFGWSEALELYKASLYKEPFKKEPDTICGVNKADLKRYVDAWELVQLHGSLRLANHYAMKNHCLSDSHTADDLWTVIALVEEVGDCNE